MRPGRRWSLPFLIAAAKPGAMGRHRNCPQRVICPPLVARALQSAGIILNEGHERAISLQWFAKSELGICSRPNWHWHGVLLLSVSH
jgi:hypothetical protein